MTLETFFEQFELLADAPNGVQKLRELILQLAVQGKLVPQNSNDEFASVLLNKIHLKKTQLEKLGKIRKPITSLDSRDKPFNIPNSWEWSRINDVTLLVTDGEHATPTRISTPEVPLVTAKNVRNGHIDLGNTDFVSFETAQKCWKRCEPLHNDILMVCVGATTGRLSILKNPSKFVLVRSVALIRPANPHIYPEFLALAIKSPLGQSQVWGNVKQSAQPCLYINKIQNIYIPIPPTAEQKRIVDKVDRLMAMCDRLEEQQKKRRESCIRLNEGAIAQLLSASNAEESDRQWQHICNNFDLLYNLPDNIVKLRQAIMQLAVQGKLVPQNSNDVPASLLLENIKEERQQLIKAGKISARKTTGSGKLENIPYEVPSNWIWVRLPEVCPVITDGEHLTPKYVDFGVPILSAKHIGQRELLFKDFKYVSNEDARKFQSRCNPEVGDVLVVSRGAGIGRSIISDKSQYCLMGSVLLFKLSKFLLNEFLLCFLMSSLGNERLRASSGATAQQAIYIAHLKRDYMVPLPPFEEQKRIVAKVDRLMKLCDELETKLKDSSANQEKLMEVAALQLMQATAKTPALR